MSPPGRRVRLLYSIGVDEYVKAIVDPSLPRAELPSLMTRSNDKHTPDPSIKMQQLEYHPVVFDSFLKALHASTESLPSSQSRFGTFRVALLPQQPQTASMGATIYAITANRHL